MISLTALHGHGSECFNVQLDLQYCLGLFQLLCKRLKSVLKTVLVNLLCFVITFLREDFIVSVNGASSFHINSQNTYTAHEKYIFNEIKIVAC